MGILTNYSPDTSPRSDGRCGTGFDDATCDPNGEYGGCCSQYGYCGSTTGHCDPAQGCQNGCTSATTSASGSSPSSTAPRDDGRCGSQFGGATCDANGAYGGCCSSYGYCGKTEAHCSTDQGCQSGCTDPVLTTSDGGSAATTVNTATQTLTGEPIISAKTTAGSQATGVPTTDGTCGASYDNTVCGDWPNGSCCSMYGEYEEMSRNYILWTWS